MGGRRDYLRERAGGWYYWRRTPLAYRAMDTRTFVRVSLRIPVVEDPKGVRAARAAHQENIVTEAYWRGLAEGRAAEAETRYQAARDRARALGFDYVEAAAFRDRPYADLAARLEALMSRRDLEVAGETDVAAALGGEARPAFRLSKLFDDFEKLQKGSLADLSPDQLRKWRNPKKRALANIIGVVGDKELSRLTRDDALAYRDWWQDRVIHGGVQAATANKDFSHVNRMFCEVNERRRLGLQPVFSALQIEGETVESREPYDVQFVATKLLGSRALDRLNEEARAILMIVADTGLRPSEAANLVSRTIRLAHKIPHVVVQADGRRMKTPQSKREIPLVGVALEAAKRFPNGFPRYRDKSGALSATVNKFLEENGLRPTPDTSFYSLRHTFEDRLTAAEAPEKLIAALMGHKYYRPKYGKGFSLEMKQAWLRKIAFTSVPEAPARIVT